MTHRTSRELRRALGHPVIDVDGHLWEFEPRVLEYVGDIAGGAIADRVRALTSKGLSRWYDLSPAERQRLRPVRPPWWGMPARSSEDFATAMLPRLFYERLDEFGIDFAIIYPTLGAFLMQAADDEARPLVCRALNTYSADQYRELKDRMTPAAILPMRTPEEAIAELEHAVLTLKLKVVVIPSVFPRPVPAFAELVKGQPELQRRAAWLDNFALDSAYDYDPLWRRCVELKVAPTAHLSGHWGSRTSVNNYVYNHVGLFAAAGEALCKALLIGGVTHRFPALKFAFLEGGAGWACSLFADLLGHWEKRAGKFIGQLDPRRVDVAKVRALAERYGGKLTDGKLDQLLELSMFQIGFREEPELRDEFARSGIEKAEDLKEMFQRSLFFGCEGEDPTNVWAFDSKVNPLGARMNAMFGSDLGHWDVPDMSEVLEEAHELVEDGCMSEQDFRDFAFVNAVRLHGGMNPDFFEGTPIARQAKEVL